MDNSLIAKKIHRNLTTFGFTKYNVNFSKNTYIWIEHSINQLWNKATDKKYTIKICETFIAVVTTCTEE